MLARIIGLYLISLVSASNGKCRILAIGGGTDRGAYEAGAIQGLVNYLPSGEATWDVVIGTGVGAINGLFLSQYPQGDESSAAEELKSFWTSFQVSQFYKDWIGGFVTGLFVESGLFNTSPIKKTIEDLNVKPSQRFFGVGATDLMTSSYIFFNTSLLSQKTMNMGIQGSTADYFFFPYVNYDTFRLSTGSIKYSVDVWHGFNACFQMGYDESEIILDVVMGAGKSIEDIDAKNYKTFQVLGRTFEIMSYEDSRLILDNAKMNFPDVDYRTTIFPTAKLETPLYPYDYSAEELAAQFQLGVGDAQKALSISLEKY
ncbi:hypothetical protein SteCoe_11367 [Stentor coeruleus]|uniref:PNPLA domain-containing protein n=1 Tax=Stentor coeruleus TaxID=5963 RepID=A0A1R2CD98_9CILI|nr:hypothetical protein SteCoe_11367 [Stentor coeruleus]